MRRLLFAAALSLLPAIAFGGYRASSFRKENRLGDNYWNAGAAVDNNLESCWKIDPENENVGQWIEIDIPMGTIDKLAMVVGWDKDEDTFSDWVRVKKVNVQVFDEAADDENKPVLEQVASFEDKRGWQVFDLNDVKVGNELSGGKVRITVAETFGEEVDYPSLAISEVLIHLQENDAPTLFTSEPAPSDAKNPPANMNDEDERTYWLAADSGVGQTMAVEASGFGVSGLVFYPGPTTYSRLKKAKILVNNQETVVELEDKPGEWQHVRLPSLSGYTGSAWGEIQLEILEVYPGKTEQLAIGELRIKQTTYEGL